MKTRQATMSLTYNGAAVTTTMAPYIKDMTYTDPASGSADSLDITIHDRENQWITSWLPIAGDTITATITVENWDYEGDTRNLPCGMFILDEFSFSGPPVNGTIAGVSSPIDGAFAATTKTATWENVTIQEVAKQIALAAGVELVWDVTGCDWTIAALTQDDKTDSAFLSELCTTYGLCMKIYTMKIVIYDLEVAKEKDAVKTIDLVDMESWEWKRSTVGTYTGGTYAYTDPATEEEVTATYGTGTRLLALSGTADSAADAERKLVAAINTANHSAVTLSVTMRGTADLVASQCVTITGIGKLSGKYFVDSVTHTLSGGYLMDLTLSLISNLAAEVIEDAIYRLVAVDVINTPSYWLAHYTDVNCLDGLLLNMATVIKTNQGGSSITTVTDALTVLTAKGVLNSPDYWATKYTALASLDLLLIKAANALTT